MVSFLGGFNTGKKRRKVWKVAPLCLFWQVWKERNKIAFDNEELSIHRLKNSFVCNIWSWTMIGAKICALMAHIRYDLCTKGHSNHPT